MYIANCPFNKIKILSQATIGLEKSFRMRESGTCNRYVSGTKKILGSLLCTKHKARLYFSGINNMYDVKIIRIVLM